MEFSDSNIKKFLIFLGNGNPEKTSYIFSKESLSYISGKWNFLTTSLKNFLYFRKELARPENQKKSILVFKHKRKRKRFLILFLIKKQNFLNLNTLL